MKNIMPLMVSQKKSTQKVKKNTLEVSKPPIKLDFIPYINFDFTFDKYHQSKRTRDLILSPEDEELSRKHLFSDREYITKKLFHEYRIHLSSEQNRQLINYTLKLIMPEKTMKQFKKQGMTVKEMSDHFMVQTHIVYMRLNLTE